MSLVIKLSAIIFFACWIGTPAIAQDRQVRIERLEVDGKPVKAHLKVQIVTESKVYKVKTNDEGFVVPADVIANNVDKYVGVIIRFKKFVLMFSTVHSSNFNVAWKVVGVNTGPFDEGDFDGSDPSEIQSVYYIEFAGEPGRHLSVTVSKPKVKVKRRN